jgi:Na+/melibiose symporter-like transporter
MEREKKWLSFWVLATVVIMVAALICIPGGSRLLRRDTLFFTGGIVLLVAGGALVFFHKGKDCWLAEGFSDTDRSFCCWNYGWGNFT